MVPMADIMPPRSGTAEADISPGARPPKPPDPLGVEPLSPLYQIGAQTAPEVAPLVKVLDTALEHFLEVALEAQSD
jgi:hypothetical protein